ncbi:MAG TPA: DUF5060 domain-containing protein [Bacteroidales bacterium]|nr:DUF5060 domain-containing protein [Bacteroidales bacterium]
MSYTDKISNVNRSRYLIPALLVLLIFFLHGCTSKDNKYPQGNNIGVVISGINSEQVKKYEKFELLLDLNNVRYDNPYDQADIDLYALFTAPSGQSIKINGFFDDYRGANKWKIRFSPRETGEYKFHVYVKDGSATGETEGSSFTAVDSEHHGWIKPSEKNPHYFTYDDGTTYYGVGAYSPWGNDEKVFRTFVENKANFFAIWDINYGGFVNSAGVIEEKLGEYNQEKLGQIDSLLSILEKDNISLMYAIWPHDLFSETVWAHQWKLNPYSQITTVENVYSDSLAWEYQKIKYRYMIARFAHSRSWGIWELINEMDGTDGWAKGHHKEAFAWVDKCAKYFAENDPYKHPLTASFSGGFKQYRDTLYRLTEVPNIHLYPAQGWIPKYPEDSLRSDMHNFAWASKRFWDNFEKPAIFGEAGADLTYYKPDSKEYHISYHNHIWASLSNGLAVTPVWWTASIMNDNDWKQLKYLSEFVADIDFANLPYTPLQSEATNADVYVMDSGDKGFGWARVVKNNKIDNTRLTLIKPDKANYNIVWFDTWTGNIVKSENVTSGNGKLVITVPGLDHHYQDIAFKISKK